LTEGILPGVGVLESIFHGWFIEFERYARSDGYTHIREREKELQEVNVPWSYVGERQELVRNELFR
jgi:hypothetical protein